MAVSLNRPPQLNSGQLREKAREVALSVLDISYRNRIGHVGSALSISDILTALYFTRLRINRKTLDHPERDRFILSKGHAAAALYAALYHRGILDKREFDSFGCDGGLCEHPEIKDPGVEMTAGSLGHGLAFGAGIALGLRKKYAVSGIRYTVSNPKNIRNTEYRTRNTFPHVFVLISDGECGEGSVWEAALFASRMGLDNLTAILDYNGWQCFGRVKDITPLEPVGDKWRSFGWDAVEVNGHDTTALAGVFRSPNLSGKPRIIIARTVSGKGVPAIENQLIGHYKVFTEAEYLTGRQELLSH
ncbi:hypothetical protein A2Z33_03930 [Candidatus Gottesmanbacteria bacterium RBG_16_52_11]|uniref:Transketolase N-terminal domain-containing protein n=1 Tax=Candidatus Gottesmanbacteria bacterium RBG_16_52_11 TaxID=1798374 RepID=A0A1F5YVQ7_9BACT|nr:MAG: hypothetical protein A2Z33_03930 [Candidatus Gottesmanbacteria bacterium RBG_16_52_11]